MTYKRQIM